MALFGKKKGGDSSPAAESPSGASSAKFIANPEKAAQFFDHARAMHETGNYEYAVTLWLQGLRWDPTSLVSLEAMHASAQLYLQGAAKPGPTRDQIKSSSEKGAIEKYLTALLNWSTRPGDVSWGLKALEGCAKLELTECAYWIGERVLRAARVKPKKDPFVKLKDVFVELGVYDLAVKAGEDALTLDRSDPVLETEVRNLSAQAAMTEGGYEKTGKEGGFRANIRDVEAQRLLDEETSSVKSEDAKTRLVEAAKEDYESRPTDGAAVMKYARALQDRAAPNDEKTAYQVLMKAFEQLKEFRFRQAAGDLKLRIGKRKLQKLRDVARVSDPDSKSPQRYELARQQLAELEVEELKLRIDAYPTNVTLKYELGRRCFELERFEEAIELLQEAQHDPKNRIAAQNYLGKSFESMGWLTEAAEMLRAAIEHHEDPTNELGLDLRYSLMRVTQSVGEQEKDLSAAEEALKLASGIAMQQLSYRDIRQRREALQKLVKAIKAGD